ncbi:DUF262 domain-containing protein [Staphylococcus equorum]|uniref:DUF262 domain-containing protein n=1 Tax=Staphylococcus equorum TaxID=246432 RepID=UPI0023AEDEA9|nr:DUF262 domain-containing protein [Staphylococcus equorum]
METRTFEELQNKLKLPTFQRALVWSNNQKKEFFNTLKDGYPFGSILLYEYENDSKYSLIDGLQRYTTMQDFKNNPTSYIEFDEFTDKVSGLYKDASDSTYAEVNNYTKDILLEIIEQNIDPNQKNAPATLLSNKLADKFPVLNDQELRDEITNIQQSVNEFFNDQINISKVKIPCIIFEGEETFSNYKIHGFTFINDEYIPVKTWKAFFVELFKLLAKIDINPLIECTKIDTNYGFESVILKEKIKDSEEIIPGVYLFLILSNERKMNYINKFFEKYNISYDQLSLDVEYKE